RMQPENRFGLESADAWVGAYQPAYKLAASIDQAGEQARTMTVLAFQDGNLPQVEGAVARAGGRVVYRSDNGINKILRVSLTGKGAAILAQHGDVEWIEPYVTPVLHNVNAQWEVQTGVSGNRHLWDMGLHGEGQVIHHSDSGINMLHEMFVDPLVPVND